MNNKSNTKKKTALITGGGTGIGKGIALVLAKAGYDVAVHYNSSAKGALEVCEQIHQLGQEAEAIQGDLSSIAGIEKLFDACRAKFEHLDLFVNNSGLTIKTPFLETTEKVFDSICDLDLKAAYFCMQQAAKWMKETGAKGSIVVISSNNYIAHFPNSTVYGAVKAGLTKLAEHIAVETAAHGIRVNTVAPGWTDTGAARLGDKEATYCGIPLKRWCTPEEVGHAVLYFSSPYAASVTGTTLVIDGGTLLLSDKSDRYGL